MPTEFKFEDLDLREQPARGDLETDATTLYGNSCASYHCGTYLCSANCCCPTC
jgi:hypothetical protein